MTMLALSARPRNPAGAMPTFDELIVDAWEGLAARRLVACLVCGEQMEPEQGAQLRPIGGHCAHCGSSLN